jgi:hypothetical protein
MHDLGKILLSCVSPLDYRQLLIAAIVDNRSLLELEQEHFGLTHEEAGAVFAKKNRFPPAVIDALAHHSKPEAAEHETLLVAVVNVANYLAKIHGLGFSGSPLGEGELELESTPGWLVIAAEGNLSMDAAAFQSALLPYFATLRKEMHEWLVGRKH